jgi:hypothetical protein
MEAATWRTFPEKFVTLVNFVNFVEVPFPNLPFEFDPVKYRFFEVSMIAVIWSPHTIV